RAVGERGAGHALHYGRSRPSRCQSDRPTGSKTLGLGRMTTTFAWPSLLQSLLAGKNLSISEATWAMRQVMAGEVSDARLAAFLVALRAKGETVAEIVGFRDAILADARPLDVDPMAVDIVG